MSQNGPKSEFVKIFFQTITTLSSGTKYPWNPTEIWYFFGKYARASSVRSLAFRNTTKACASGSLYGETKVENGKFEKKSKSWKNRKFVQKSKTYQICNSGRNQWHQYTLIFLINIRILYKRRLRWRIASCLPDPSLSSRILYMINSVWLHLAKPHSPVVILIFTIIDAVFRVGGVFIDINF